MNDELLPGSGSSGMDGTPPPAPEAVPRFDAGSATAGGLIRVARQAQGQDLASLAAMLKVPLRKLEALETDRHAELQGPTFERALAQAACRVLRIDPGPVLALLPPVEGDTLENVTGGLNKPFRERQVRGGAESRGALLSRPVLVLIAALAVGAAAMFFLPTGFWQGLATPFAGQSSPSPSTSQPAAAAPGAPADVAARVLPSTVAAPAFEPASAAATETAGVSPAAVVPPPGVPVQLIASEPSWVEVHDAQGRPLFSRILVAGETVPLDGAMPMHLKIGNAPATRVMLRGERVDLAPFTRDKLARFELK